MHFEIKQNIDEKDQLIAGLRKTSFEYVMRLKNSDTLHDSIRVNNTYLYCYAKMLRQESIKDKETMKKMTKDMNESKNMSVKYEECEVFRNDDDDMECTCLNEVSNDDESDSQHEEDRFSETQNDTDRRTCDDVEVKNVKETKTIIERDTTETQKGKIDYHKIVEELCLMNENLVFELEDGNTCEHSFYKLIMSDVYWDVKIQKYENGKFYLTIKPGYR